MQACLAQVNRLNPRVKVIVSHDDADLLRRKPTTATGNSDKEVAAPEGAGFHSP